VTLSIDAAQPPTRGPSDAPAAPPSLRGPDFAATLRDYTGTDETRDKHFARINDLLRVDRRVYRDRFGCRSWLVW
jgi:hypothetical protein